MILSSFLAAALAIAPSDRMAMADRLFNRGDYVSARKEYVALENEKSLDRAQRAALLYRLIAIGKAQKDDAFVRAKGTAFLNEFPGHEKETQVRFFRALAGNDTEKIAELRDLDRDDVPKDIRAGALCILGTQLNDDSLLDRSIKLDPRGGYTAYAKSTRATKLMKSTDPADRRRAVELFNDLIYGKDPELSKEALYAATYMSYSDGKYSEADSLAKRFLQKYPADTRVRAVRSILAMSNYRLGRYVAALDFCTDDNDEWQLLVQASAHERLGHRVEARKAAERGLTLFPKGECRAMLELTRAHLDFADAADRQDKKGALEAARRAAEISKSSADRLRVAWALENNGEFTEAEEEYSLLARDFPNTEISADALYRRAMSLLRREQWSAAEISLDEAIASGKLASERQSSAYYWRGIAANKLGHVQESVDLLRKALAGSLSLNERREARLVIADADYNDGRREEAVSAYAELVREGALERMSAAKTLAVGKLLPEEEARLCAKALIENKSPEWRQAGYAFLGDLEWAAENFTAAAYAYQQCLDEPCQSEVISHVSLVLGRYFVREGNVLDGEKTLRRAVELNSDNNEARASAYIGLAQAALLRDDTEAAKYYATVVETLYGATQAAAEAKEILK